MIRLTDYTELKTIQDFCKLSDDRKESIIQGLQKIDKQKIISIPEVKSEKEDFKVLSYFNGEFWTQNYVGFLNVNGEDIFIKSRFDRSDKLFFTRYLLQRALKLEASLFPDMEVNTSKDVFLEMLLAIVFVNQICMAYRKGIYRKYRTFEKNDSKIKGKIDFGRHIRLNPIFNGKIAYSYREFTIENDVNRIILTAYDFLEKRYGKLIRQLVRDKKDVVKYMEQLKHIMRPASRQEAKRLLKKENRKIVHPIYKEWDVVRKTAVMILRHIGVQVAEKDNQKITGILINMNKIWELYLEDTMREIPGLKMQDSREFLIREGETETVEVEIRPDFCFYDLEKKKKVTLILDAKYKNSWEKVAEGQKSEEQKPKWPREDTFQLATYMYTLACPKSGIICPLIKKEEVKDWERRVAVYDLKGEDRPRLRVIPLQISQEKEDAHDFQKEMKDNEEDFKERIEKYLKDK